MTAAVTPVPQLLMMGLVGSMPLARKTSRSWSAGRKALVVGSRRSETGTEMLEGMWPELRPGWARWLA